MLILIDVNGTLQNNVAGYSDALCAEAALVLKEAGHQVCVCSASPGPDQLDKARALGGDIRGAIVVDDDTAILSCAARKGAIAVPAARLLELAEMLGGAR